MPGSLGRVLVVDDDDVIRQLITVNLELEGFEVATAVDGQDCLDKVQEVDPVVITLDIMMPRLDGMKVLREVGSDDDLRGTPVILLSAKATSLDIELGLKAGAADYVTKPVDPIELVDRIKSILAKAG